MLKFQLKNFVGTFCRLSIIMGRKPPNPLSPDFVTSTSSSYRPPVLCPRSDKPVVKDERVTNERVGLELQEKRRRKHLLPKDGFSYSV